VYATDAAPARLTAAAPVAVVWLASGAGLFGETVVNLVVLRVGAKRRGVWEALVVM
jgi:hypothetical protein